MTLSVDLSSPVPVYRQIVAALRPLLLAGQLKPGDLLPPVRQLAADLGVHFNTVAEAYRILADEGWLDLRRRRGAAVLARETPQAPPSVTTNFSRRLWEFIAELRAAGVPAPDLARELRQIAEGLE